VSITSVIIDPILNLRGAAAYSLVTALAFAEAAAFVGFVLPGETAVILGGVLAYRHSVFTDDHGGHRRRDRGSRRQRRL
jgi:membrane protein DedA with SNARE-associated domain